MTPPDERVLVVDEPTLTDPVLVVALEGWIDAGFGAATAIAALLEITGSTIVATFDGEYFLDQRARRPMARIVDGVTAELRWPEIQLRRGTDASGRDVLLLVGPEPDFHWLEFAELVVTLAERFGVRLVVGLGAFPAPAPHTRPVRLAATVPQASQHLLEKVGLVAGELEVPAGIVSALELAFADAEIEAITLWARVPHYVATLPYPQASVALLDGLAAIAGLSLAAESLRKAAEDARSRVNELVA
ncbi:MAG TPA: PAC2 family protein, partial [Acidimicrobiales bacterium]|nr:PAC2 family protein [Acidimicrobiales bacterium]